MIKIIELGSRREQRCDNCGCLFSYEEIDSVETVRRRGESYV